MNKALSPDLLDELQKDAASVWPENFDEIEEMFNRCCFSMAFSAVKKFGLFTEKGDFETVESIDGKIKIFKDARYLFDNILRILVEEKVLEKRDGGFLCVDPDPYIETPAEILVTATRKFKNEGAPFQWLARAQDGLVDFIKGNLYAEEVMFPMGSFKLVEEVYNTSDVYGFYSRLAGKVVKRIISEYFSSEHFNSKVTMLETGAGTGNGTANVLSESDGKFSKYYFTDISKSLVQMGRRRFKKQGYDFIDYMTFDACDDLTVQGFKEDSVDIVLAVNVLHATDNIMTALKNIRGLLKKDGVLVLSELSPPENGIYRYMELTFGLLPSYSVYSDRDIRPVAPIIRPDAWMAAVKDAGFENVAMVPDKRDSAMDRGGVIIAVK